MKIFRFLFPGALFVVFFLSGLLLFSESGLQFIQANINRLSGGLVVISTANGRLAGDWTLGGVRFATPGVDITLESLAWSWQPSRLLLAELNLASLSVTGMQIQFKNGTGESSPAGAVRLPKKILPLVVVLERLTVDRLRLVGSDGGEVLTIDKITAGLEGSKERLTINEFTLESPDIGFSLHGNIYAGRDWSLDLLGKLRFAGFGFHPLNGTFSVLGPLESPHVELGVITPADIRVSADIENLFDHPEWTGTLHGRDVDLSTLILYCPQIRLSTVNGDLHGDFGNYRGLVEAEGSWDELTDLHLVSRLYGDGLGIDFQSLRIERGNSIAEVKQGKISWKDIFGWEGRFFFKDVDPSVITKSLQGELTTDFFSIGDVREQGVVASFEIFSLDTTLSDQPVSAKGNVFLTENDVHTDGLTFRSGDVEGTAHVERGILSWAEGLRWSTSIRLDDFNPAWLHPDFPGSVSGNFSSEGALDNNGPEGFVNIAEISGTLRGKALSGGGEINLSGESLQTTGLVMKSGRTELVVQGRAGDTLDLDLSLSSPDIKEIIEGGSGSLLLNGNLRGSRKEPRIEVKVEGNGLRYQEHSVESLLAELQTELKPGGRFKGSVLGTALFFSGVAFREGRIEAEGTPAEHEIIVSVSGGIGDVQARAVGAYQDQWQGELSLLQLESSSYGEWLQQGGSAISAGSRGVSLDEVCLSDGAGRICLEGDVQLEGEPLWTVRGGMEAVPLNWLNRLKLLSIPVKGVLDADISATGDTLRVLSGQAKVSLPEGDFVINSEEGETVPFLFDDSLLTLLLADRVLQARFTSSMKSGSEMDLRAEIEGICTFSGPLLSLPVTGRLDLEKFNLASLAAFTDYSMEATGLLNSSLLLSGTIGRPLIHGQSSIDNGGINLLHQGIFLENLALSLEAGGDGAKITATATSGPGKITANGTLLYGAFGLEGDIYARGSEFLLVDLPEYTLRVTPDVQFLFSKEKGEIKGTVEVPYGLITPEEMSDSISESEDVIIVNGLGSETKKGWPFNVDLDVRLGDDVRIEGYGLTGRLAGGLRVNTSRDNSLSGKGELDLIDGTFSIYGRTLQIERGRVLFNRGPIDNPGLDVRAQVKVSDVEARGRGYTVGVDISGLVQDLKFHLFSDPFMEDTEIISQMVAGRPTAGSSKAEGSLLEAAAKTVGLESGAKFVQGIGDMLQLDDLYIEGGIKKDDVALVVGKRVTEDLYIGYDVNMFSQLGQFRVRYDLDRGFSVETRSSSESSGADLIYSFEK